ncbi:uncharacterized protein LOC132309101 [Cornus florida]|uniref:uncharacterized protein LOC132309101 n=1 Tax=Cornus florida TaxID=4283 RepID=UPI00289F48D0|nr:uncharacterized protein LOC132309101 [Cornus florida]
MKVLVWNCQGLGNPLTVSQLRRLVSLHSPPLIFFSETKNTRDRVDHLCVLLGSYEVFKVPSVGRSGGLALLFSKEWQISIIDFFEFQITCKVVGGKGDRPWFFTGVYGSCKDKERAFQWRYLHSLMYQLGPQWILMGDFNVVLHKDEKRGGRIKQGWMLKEFRFFLEDCKLVDLYFKGSPFTWRNNRDSVQGSDHNAILLCLNNSISHSKRNFYFDARWVKDEGFKPVIEKTWDVSFPGPPLQEQELGQAWREEELYWLQKSRIAWLHHRDKNTNFHRKTKIRRRKNEFFGIEDHRGQWQDSKDDIRRVAKDYFQNLFTALPSQDDFLFWELVQSKVSSEMNRELLQEGTAEELFSALDCMGPFKSPGPDGFTPLFFQSNWAILKGALVQAFNSFLQGHPFPAELNSTLLVFIPKVPHPTSMQNFRPIALCNVSYKIFSKALANRLEPFLPCLINDAQSAFVPNRLIHDNIFLAHDLMHVLKSKKYGDSHLMALKLDMAKAYDRVSWSFLRQFMLWLGFDQQ